MTLTARGRDRELHAFAHRFLGELSATTRDYAPPESDGWYTDYALGFAAGHVGLAIGLAKRRHAFDWLSRSLKDEHVPALVYEIVPDCLGLDRERFIAAFENAADRRKEADSYHPMNLGFGTGYTVLCISLARTLTSVRRDFFGVQAMNLELELRKLRAPTRLGRLTGYRSATLIYRYMVMRTLGETVFGATTDQATRFAQNYRQLAKNGTDAKAS